MGCAAKICTDGLRGTSWSAGVLVVCRFSPPGNMPGEFAANVLRPGAAPAPTPQPPPAPTPGPGGGGGGGGGGSGTLTPDLSEMLERTNKARRDHGAAALTWDVTLAVNAATAAARCTLDPGNAARGFGTNTYVATGGAADALRGALANWYGSRVSYDFASPGWQPRAASFTQLVWRASTRLGCAAHECSSGIEGVSWPSGTVVVCRYSPGGNPTSVPSSVYYSNVWPSPEGPGLGPSPTPRPAPPPGDGGAGETPSRRVLAPGMSLTSPECLLSANGQHKLCVLDSGNVVLYTAGEPAWTSNTAYKSTATPFKLQLSATLPQLTGAWHAMHGREPC